MDGFTPGRETIMVIPMLHEESEPQRLNHLPKATQSESSRAGIPQGCLIPKARASGHLPRAAPLLYFSPSSLPSPSAPGSRKTTSKAPQPWWALHLWD